MTRLKLIVNPAAGGGTARRSVPRIEKLLSSAGASFDLEYTERPLHAIELARRTAGEGYDAIVAVGGDGTANEVLNGILLAKNAGEGSAALGVLCVGRGNDFAFGAEIPQDVDAGCSVLAAGHRRTIDVGLVRGPDLPDDRFFGNGVGIGFDTVVGLEAAKLKRLRGFAGYFVAALKTIFLYFRAPHVRVECEGEPFEGRALMVSIMNGRRLGGGFMMAPEGSMSDGTFDLCIAQEVSRLRIFALILRFMKGTQASHGAIHMSRTNRVTTSAVDGALPAHADGELLCEGGSRLEVSLVPKAIEVICSPAGEGR
jgi:YegS/Rv2252/BmrU family lipid kinase